MKTLDRLLKESEHIEPVPQVIHQLMDRVDDPEVPVAEIVELILYEPVVTANLLKLANSVTFGFRRKVNSIHDAVVLLGINRVVEMALLCGVTPALRHRQQGYGLAEGQLWKQSVSCALLANDIAEAVRAPVKHVVFTAALLKDIGIIVLNRAMGAAMAQVRSLMAQEHLGLAQAERQVLGIDHAYLAGQMAMRWNFAGVLVRAIEKHHLDDDATDVSPETAMVYLADSICSMSGINSELFCGHYEHYERVCAQLGLPETRVNRIMSDFYSRKEAIYGLLAIL